MMIFLRLQLSALLFVLASSASINAPAAWELKHGPLKQTPCGYRPAVCVREAPHGSSIREATAKEATDNNDADLAVVHESGKVSEFISVPQVCHDFMGMLIEHSAPRSASHVGNVSSVPNGWLMSAGVYQMDPTPNALINKFAATWTVPAAPTSPATPETLYYFIGLEDRTMGKLTTIHQPVLTWGDETEGGQFPGQWHLWSWTCCPKNLTWHSPDIAGFAPGDTIHGSIEKVGDATWKIHGAFYDKSKSAWQNTSLTSEVGSFNYNYADVTLEVYNITNCEQMSRGSVQFDSLHLALADGSDWVPPMWYITGQSSNCGTKMHILNKTSMVISGAATDNDAEVHAYPQQLVV